MHTPDRGKKSDQQAVGTAGRVSSRKKKARPFGESKLPFYIDSSGFYRFAKEYRVEADVNGSKTKRSIVDIMDCCCSEYGAEELSRRANFKGGVTLKVENESASVQYSREQVDHFLIFKSELNLDKIRQEVLPKDSPVAPFFQNHFIDDLDKKEFVNTLLAAIGCYIFTLNSTAQSDIDKRDIIAAGYNKIKEDFEDLPDLESMLEGNISDNINSLIQKVINEINVPNIGPFFDPTYICDSRNFSAANKKLFQDSIRYEDDVSPFYVIYRMGYTTKVKVIQDTDGSSPSPEKVGYNRYKQTSISINGCVANFANYVFQRFKESKLYDETSNEFKKTFKAAYTVLVNVYIEFDREYHDLIKRKDYKVEDIETSEEYLHMISSLSAVEERVVSESFGGEISLFQFKKYFYDYILDDDLQSDRYLDKSFDANDFAACWDSIANGLPLLTNNAALIKQTRSNLTRSFLLGRDVQVVVMDDVVKFFKKGGLDFTVLDITDKHLWEYCYENLDMAKLWGMTSSAKGIQFSQEYNGISWSDSLSDDVSGALFPGPDDFRSDFPDLKLGANDSGANTSKDQLGRFGLFQPINHAPSVESDEIINPKPKSGGGGKK